MLAQNAQRCVHAESQEKEGGEGGRGRGSLDTEVFAAVDEHWLGVQPGSSPFAARREVPAAVLGMLVPVARQSVAVGNPHMRNHYPPISKASG